MPGRILVVDDEKMIRWSLVQALEGAGYAVEEAAEAASALRAIEREAPDLVLLDYRLPDRTGVEVLKELQTLAPRLPVVMITAHASLGGAVEAVKEGAYDYIGKPFEIDTVIQTVARAIEAARLREKVARQQEETLRQFGLSEVVAESPAMKSVAGLVQRIAASEASTILLLGESGVGKGLVARTLHTAGESRGKPFMHITCTSLTENLLESELFGHERGSFTDAKVQKKGLFELADGGTVFLDEIGDLSLSFQAKLLRFLEDKVFRRVGGTRDIQVSVRIIAATNKDLAREVETGSFRKDLYFRLRVIPIVIPPLRERAEDVLPLAEGFIRHFCREFRKDVAGLSPEAAKLVQAYPWWGNVRELRNAIERAVLLTENAQILAEDLPVELSSGRARTDGLEAPRDGFELPTGGLALDELEKDLVRQALERSRGNRTRAARLLGLNRDQIRYRIEKFGLEIHGSHSD